MQSQPDRSEVDPTEPTLLMEYHKAQDSAQFNDGIVWTSTGITWGMTIVLLGFSLTHLDAKIPVTLVSALGVFTILFQWQVQSTQRSVKNQKYERCREIEKELGMRANLNLRYPRNRQTAFYRAINSCFLALWIYALGAAWGWIPK